MSNCGNIEHGMIEPRKPCFSLFFEKVGDTKQKELLEARNTKSHCTDQNAHTHRLMSLRQSHINFCKLYVWNDVCAISVVFKRSINAWLLQFNWMVWMKSDGQQFVKFACLHFSTAAAFLWCKINILLKTDTFSFWIDFSVHRFYEHLFRQAGFTYC